MTRTPVRVFFLSIPRSLTEPPQIVILPVQVNNRRKWAYISPVEVITKTLRFSSFSAIIADFFIKGRSIMPKTREQKEQMVAELADKFGKMKSCVFTSISGYTMEDANTLRSKGREQGIELSVTKKTLLLHALKAFGVDADKEQFEGSILTAIGHEDEVAAAKLIAEFAKEREGINMVGGVLEGSLVDSVAVTKLSALPSKQELLAKVVGSINAPTSGFVNALAGNLRNMVYVLNAIKDKAAAK